MSPPLPPQNPTDIVEVVLTPQNPPDGSVLVRLAALVNETVRQAQQKDAPKLNPKKWEAADPDAAPTPLAEAMAQAEDAIHDIAAASQQRGAELAREMNQPVPPVEATNRLRAAEDEVRRVIEKLIHDGLVPIAEVLVESPVVSERES